MKLKKVELVFWEEDGEWVGSLETWPVAACGETLDEAIDNLRKAIAAHWDALKREEIRPA